MKLKFFIFHFSFFIFFIGCSVKTTPIYVVFNTPKIKISDQGFLKQSFGYKKLIIYKAGNVPIKITIKNSYICYNNQCLDKEKFIHEYLSPDYPSDFLDKLLDKKCINGYKCIVKDGKILFKDKKHHIIIMIKDIK